MAPAGHRNPALSIEDLIASVSDRLTPTERRIAEVVLQEPMLLAFGTVSDLAGRVRTSRPSIVRFASKLGFAGYTELQQLVREGVSRQLSSPSERIRQRRHTSPIRADIEAAVLRTLDALDSTRLATLAVPLVEAGSVWIISGETSMAGAHVLHSGLAMVRPNVNLVEEHAIGRDLTNISKGDVAVVFDFARYRRSAITAARTLAERDVTLVAITDGPLSPLASLTQYWCELSIPAVGPFDSSIPAVAAAELLIVEVVDRLGGAARERIDRLESMWQATSTFLTEPP